MFIQHIVRQGSYCGVSLGSSLLTDTTSSRPKLRNVSESLVVKHFVMAAKLVLTCEEGSASFNEKVLTLVEGGKVTVELGVDVICEWFLICIIY